MGEVTHAVTLNTQDTEADTEIPSQKKLFPRYLSVMYFSLLLFQHTTIT